MSSKKREKPKVITPKDLDQRIKALIEQRAVIRDRRDGAQRALAEANSMLTGIEHRIAELQDLMAGLDRKKAVEEEPSPEAQESDSTKED